MKLIYEVHLTGVVITQIERPISVFYTVSEVRDIILIYMYDKVVLLY